MKQFSVAPIIAAKDNIPEARHLPFFVTKIDDVILTAHFAKANEHWNYIEDSEVLVIFTEPHAYVSTENHSVELEVPKIFLQLTNKNHI